MENTKSTPFSRAMNEWWDIIGDDMNKVAIRIGLMRISLFVSMSTEEVHKCAGDCDTVDLGYEHYCVCKKCGNVFPF